MRVSPASSRSRVAGRILLCASAACLVAMAVTLIVRVKSYPSLQLNAVPLSEYVTLTVVAYVALAAAFAGAGLLCRRHGAVG